MSELSEKVAELEKEANQWHNSSFFKEQQELKKDRDYWKNLAYIRNTLHVAKLTKELEELRKELVWIKDCSWQKDLSEAKAERDRLKTFNAELRTSLKWYKELPVYMKNAELAKVLEDTKEELKGVTLGRDTWRDTANRYVAQLTDANCELAKVKQELVGYEPMAQTLELLTRKINTIRNVVL